MIEEIIQNYLRENAFPCYTSVPEKPSGNFCVLEKTGSGYEDGRLYNGAWYHISFLPVPEPNEAVFDEFPETGNGTSCSDYVWDGKKLIYSPPESPAAPVPAVQIADDGTEVTYT